MERLFQSSILGCWLLLVVVQGYVITPNHHHRPKASVQRTTPTTLGLGNNNNDSDNSSTASQKIQEMAAFVSVGLLQSVVKEMTNTNMDSDEVVSDQTIQAMDRLTKALQMKSSDEAMDNAETKTANTKIASIVEEDINSGVKEEPIATALGETDTDIPSSFTNEAAAASATTSDDVLLDDEKVNEKIVDEKLESLLSDSETSQPEPEDQYAWSPLEVVASNVVPLRSSSVPKKKDPPPSVDGDAAKPIAESNTNVAPAVTPNLVESKEEKQQADAAEAAAAKQELFQRSLLAQKLEYDAQAIDKIQKQTEEAFQRKLLAKQLEQQLKEIDEAAAVDRQRAEESFQRKLLEQTLVYDSLADEQEKQQAEEVFRRKLLEEAIRYQSLAIERLEERQKAQEEVFRRKLLAEATRYQSQAVQRIQVADEIQAAAAANAAATATAAAAISETKISSAESLSAKEWVSSLPTITQERYAREAKISHSFPIRDFNPTKWSTNNHFQTIVGTLFRKEAMYSKGAKEDMGTFLDIVGVPSMATDDESRRPLEEFEWDERFRVETKDGDFYVADWKYAGSNQNIDNAVAAKEENPVCLICHGLESCSDSEIVKEIAIACNIHGIDAACLNFRGCHDSGESCNLTPRGYHLGFTDDLMLQIEQIHSQNPNQRIYLSGFSLGAGVVTKLLGELGPRAYEYNVCGAAVNAVPFDCGQNHMAINGPGFTKSIYGDRLLASMKTRLSKQYDKGGFNFDKEEIEKCKTIMDMENLCIAPIFGFDDAYDYYDKVKTIDKLHKVCVPQYVIQAKDDPFFKGLEQVNNDESIPINVQYTEYGGHCGYILHQRQDDEVGSKTSWMPRQLGRFFQHLEEARKLQPDQAEPATLVSSETLESIPVTMS